MLLLLLLLMMWLLMWLLLLLMNVKLKLTSSLFDDMDTEASPEKHLQSERAVLL